MAICFARMELDAKEAAAAPRPCDRNRETIRSTGAVVLAAANNKTRSPLAASLATGTITASQAAAILVFLGALSAIMSTADSCLLSLGSVTARDALGRVGENRENTRFGKLLAGLILLGIIPLALQRDLTLWRLIELKMELLIQCVPSFLLAIHWARQSAAATLAGLLVGTLFGVVLTLAGIPTLGGIHVGVLGLVLNTAVVIAGSLLGAAPRGRE